MTTLFSSLGRARLDELARPGLLCAFDFDGTLAPLVTQPDRAHTPSNIVARLNELSGYASIAVITGRSVADISERLGFRPHFLIGNHGLEGWAGWQAHAATYQETCRHWLAILAQALAAQPELENSVWIEDKGYSLSIHYRTARERLATEKLLFKLLPELLPSARLVGGKCVVNILPSDAPDKGGAMANLITASEASAAMYVGDDVTDEDVFRMRRADLVSIRIGHEPRSSAEFFLPHRLCILQLLDELLARYRVFHAATSRLAG